MVGVFLAVLLVLCWLSHRFVELSMQRQGRRFAGWLDTYLGPDTVLAVPASAAPADPLAAARPSPALAGPRRSGRSGPGRCAHRASLRDVRP
jgi:peptidoglycan/LPS O-acetylase OafA/YrhL